MEENNTTPFGELDWYRAKTIEEMRSDLITMAKGDYFNDETSYVFKASGDIVIRSGEELNDQAPEGPGPEEYEQMTDEQIVQQYITRIKMYPPLVEIEDKEGFAEAYLPALDNMNNVAAVFSGNTHVEYGDGMTIASEIQTGAITDYIATGFKDTKEFYDWYLSDVANLQAVMQPGQVQAEDFSIVDGSFYDDEKQTDEPFVDPMPVPNTRFPRKPEQEEDVPNTTFPRPEFTKYNRPKKFAINPNEQPLKPEVNPLQRGQDFVDIMADMRRMKPKVAKKKPVERRRFF
mgnify:CR=1 FL=1|tara:strand:+ start:1408 stop:2274 length:867 start_codon:yes stop_codon:yes gene_type:complete